MAPAHASGGRRRRGRWNLSWAWDTLLCFGSQEASLAAEGTTPWERSSRRRSKKRTVPVVDGDLLVGTAADSEVMRRGTGTGTGTDEEESRKRKGLLCIPGCCFLAPARAPGRELRSKKASVPLTLDWAVCHTHSTMDSSSSGRSKQRHPERTELPPPPRQSQSDKNSPSEASRIQATGGSTSNSNGSRCHGAEQEQPRSAPPAETTRTPTKPSKATGAGGVGAFGPVVGLSVVIAVSMAGLLGGRLWAVACVCAWLAALSRLRRREATTTAAGEVAAVDDVDSTDHKKEPVVLLRGLLERDRRKAMAA